MSLSGHVTGSGAPSGRAAKHHLSGARIDVEHCAAVVGLRRTDAQHHAHLIITSSVAFDCYLDCSTLRGSPKKVSK